MLYQLLTGRLPFTGETYEEVRHVVLTKPPHPMPATVPLWLQQVVTKAIAKKPEARYKAAREMLTALQPPVFITPATIPKPPPKPKYLRRIWVGSIGTGLAVISIWAGLHQIGDGNVEPTPTPTVAPSLTLIPKPKPTATATPKVLAKPSSTPTPVPTATPSPSPKIKPTPLPTPMPTPPVIVPKKRLAPVEKIVPRVVVPDKPKPAPHPKKQDPRLYFYRTLQVSCGFIRFNAD